jgi:hypothetical protein
MFSNIDSFWHGTPTFISNPSVPLGTRAAKEHANYFNVGFRKNSVSQRKLCQIDQMHPDFNNQQVIMTTVHPNWEGLESHSRSR